MTTAFAWRKSPFLFLRNDNSYEVGAGFAEQNRRSGASPRRVAAACRRQARHKTQIERFIFQSFVPPYVYFIKTLYRKGKRVLDGYLVSLRYSVMTFKSNSSYGVHIVDHLSADRTCLTGGEIAVVAVVQIDTDFVCRFHLELVKSCAGFGNQLVCCHCGNSSFGAAVRNGEDIRPFPRRVRRRKCVG